VTWKVGQDEVTKFADHTKLFEEVNLKPTAKSCRRMS